MKGNWRWIFVFALAISMGSVVGNPTIIAKESKATLRIVWWGSDSRHKATLNAIQTYMKKNPNVKLEAEYMGYDGYYKKLLTQLAGRTAPDIIQIDTDWSFELFGQGKFFLDLNQYPSQLNTKTLSPALIADYSPDLRKMEGLPAGVSTTTMLWNEDFFDKYGIPKKTLWTWDELLEAGRKVHRQNNKAYLLTGDIDVVNRLIVLPYLAQKTGMDWINPDYTINFDQELLTETLEYVAEAYRSGTLEPFGESSTFVGKLEQNIKWINGDIGGVICFVSGISQMKSTVPVSRRFFVTTPPIHRDAKQSANPIRASSLWTVNKGTKYPNEAVRFLNWLINSEEAAMLLGSVRSTPASSIALKALVDDAKLDPLIMAAMEGAAKNPGKSWGVLTRNPEINQINKDVLEKLAFNRIQPEEGAKVIINEYRIKLAELKAAQRR